jgi:hypothetical protein
MLGGNVLFKTLPLVELNLCGNPTMIVCRRTWRSLRFAFLVSAAPIAMFAQIAFAQQSANPVLVQNSVNAPLPPGPFSSWPVESRNPAIRALQSRCVVLIGMAFDDYQGSKEAGTKEAQALLVACISKGMPDDWPMQKEIEEKSAAFYEAAKRLDPNALDPSKFPFPKWSGK